jgi:hypothetical protein
MNRFVILRILLGIIFLSGLFLFPYWLVIFCAGITALFIPYYVEFVALVAFEEMLYASAGVVSSPLMTPAILFALFVFIELSRSLVRERILRI